MSNAELMALVKKHPISVGGGVVALLLGAGIYFRSSELPNAEEELTQKAAEAERHGANVKNATQLKEQVDALAAANKEIDSRLVRGGQIAINTQFFYKLSSETGVKLNDFRQSPPGPPGKGPKAVFTPVGFTVSATGTLAQLIDFLHRLESGAHYCRVVGSTISGAAGNRDSPLTMTLNLELLGLP
jgi:hypothetical protein